MIKGGPKIIEDGLVLCLDAHDAKSYAGEPVTNLASDSFYTWVNSGAWTSNTYTSHESSPVGFPPGLKGVSGVQVLEGICTTAGSIHFGTGHVNPASASTQYTYSVWFYQKGRAGIGAPYARANVSNSNLGTMKYNGTTGSSNWPVNKWIKLEITFTTQSSDTQTYISNYIGSQVGDTMYFCAPQSEQKSYYSPFADSSRSATDGWKDRTTNNNHGTLTNMIGTGASHYRDGQVIMPVSNSYLEFDGSDDYVSIPQFDFTSTHSLEWWFNTDNLTEKYSGGYAGHMLCWGHSPSERIQLRTNGGIRIYIHDGSSGINFDTSNFSVTAGEWTHITATLDWIGKSVKFYQNGVLKDTIDISSMGSWNYTGASNPYDYIDFGRNVSNNNIFYDGKLASIKIYNKVLTAAEVLSNYNATKERFS